FPIAVELDRYLTPDGSLILCGWHGAAFEPLSGACVAGPCAGGKLTPWPVEARDGVIRTACAAYSFGTSLGSLVKASSTSSSVIRLDGSPGWLRFCSSVPSPIMPG